jgi:hypothetical protein
MNEKEFYKELAQAPEMPDDVFEAVEEQITRRQRVVRGIYGLAACLILAIGIGIYQTGSPNSNLQSQAKPSEQVLKEIEYIENYFTGENMEREMEAYTLVDVRFYE